MDGNREKTEILSKTSFWNNLKNDEKAMVVNKSYLLEFEKNQVIASGDSSCAGVMFVMEGGIRVSLISEEGREITLYRLKKGDCCVMTASCIVKEITFDTVISAENHTKALTIPSSLSSLLLDSNIHFQAFVHEKETERFSSAMRVISDMLFKRLDQRLASYLLKKSEEMGTTDLSLTQEEIARDINSAREVVARMLRNFADEGYLEVKRGLVCILDAEGLRKLQKEKGM